MLGLQEYLESFPGDRAALNAADALANRLLDSYRAHRSADWKWFENVLAYSNARLPQALIRAGTRSANDAMVSAGLEALDWLAAVQRCETKGHFVPIGSHGFYSKKTEKARFDQQPVEACAAVSAFLQAYRATEKDAGAKKRGPPSIGSSATTTCRLLSTIPPRADVEMACILTAPTKTRAPNRPSLS